MSGLIVHEWIEKHGGAERVLDSMIETYPEAAVSCLWNTVPERYPNSKVTESWFARSPLRGHKALSLPMMPPTWRNLRSDDDVDWMLISSHLFAHHARLAGQADVRKYVYVHTPARYIWAPELDTRGKSPAVMLAAPLLKHLDRRRASEPSEIAANSAFIQDRIMTSWHRESRVIYPPVGVARLQSEPNWRDRLTDLELDFMETLPPVFVLGASRFVPYKRLDLVIEAGEVAGVPVVLAGSGPMLPELANLAANAKVRVIIAASPSDELLYALYQRALAFVFPGVEDFGLMPVEAMALGTPAIVQEIGGAAESVRAVNGGIVVNELSAESIAEAISLCEHLDMAAVPNRVCEQFDEAVFRRHLSDWMSDVNPSAADA